MAYFNHAFCKSFLATDVAADGVASSALTTAQVGVVGDTDWLTVTPSTAAPIVAPNKHLVFVQGSLHTNDNIGNNPGHGGYAESAKSKGINLRYVTRLGRSTCTAATQPTASICVGADCAPCGSNLFLRVDVKGSPALRFLNHNAYAIGDSSGDAYANGGALPGLCCATGQEYLDPAMALAAAAQMLLFDPLINPFARECQSGATLHGITVTDSTGGLDGIDTVVINAAGTGYAVGDYVSITGGGGTGGVAEVTTIGGGGAITGVSVRAAGSGYTAGAALATGVLTGGGDGLATIDITVDARIATFSITDILNGGYTPTTDPVADVVTACACFEGAYVDTTFGNCSFDTRDHYEKEPVSLIMSVLDETGDPCNDCGVFTSTPGTMTETLGERVLRDLLLTDRYMQSPYNQGNADSARIREIEGSAGIVTAIDRDGIYKAYYLQHSVPRFNNPTGVFDNDQYLIQVYVDCTDTATIGELDALWTGIEDAANALGNPVTFDTYL